MTSERRTPTSERSAAETRAGDWWLELDEHGVTARDGRGPVAAHVEVREDDAHVQLEFWVDQRVPRELRARLTSRAFEHPALRAHRPVSVGLPRGETEVLREVRSHMADASARVAGATCLLEGRVR
jgi:hypothetical protein